MNAHIVMLNLFYFLLNKSGLLVFFLSVCFSALTMIFHFALFGFEFTHAKGKG